VKKRKENTTEGERVVRDWGEWGKKPTRPSKKKGQGKIEESHYKTRVARKKSLEEGGEKHKRGNTKTLSPGKKERKKKRNQNCSRK